MAKRLQRKVAAPKPQAAAATAADSKKPKARLGGGRRVSAAALAEFTSQLAVLLDAGIPIAKCLRILEGQMAPGLLQRTVAEVVDDVEGGTALSEALAKHPIFDDLYTNMVRAGEAGGVQEEILNRLAAFMEKAEEIKSRVKGAMAYPVTIVVVAIAVLVIVFVAVIPKFKEIFEQQFGSLERMPWSTQTIIKVGEHLSSWWWAYLLGIVAVYSIHVLLVTRVPGYRKGRDSFLLKIPVFGNLLGKSLVARFTRTFGTLIQSGVPHLGALEIVRDSLNNIPMSNAVNMVHASIREGAGIAVPLGESGMFNDMVVNMVDVGEQTGELDRMLSKIADRYETEVDRTIDATFKVVETGMIVVLAVVVGFIVFALFSPLLELMDAL